MTAHEHSYQIFFNGLFKHFCWKIDWNETEVDLGRPWRWLLSETSPNFSASDPDAYNLSSGNNFNQSRVYIELDSDTLAAESTWLLSVMSCSQHVLCHEAAASATTALWAWVTCQPLFQGFLLLSFGTHGWNLFLKPAPDLSLASLWSLRICIQLYLTLCNPMDCSPQAPLSSVHGISRGRILECIAISFSRGSSPPRHRTYISCIAGGFFTNWATKEAHDTMPNTIT